MLSCFKFIEEVCVTEWQDIKVLSTEMYFPHQNGMLFLFVEEDINLNINFLK